MQNEIRLGVGIALVLIFGSIAASLNGQDSATAEEAPFRETFFMSEYEQEQGVAQAVRVGGVVFVSATTATGDTMEEQMKGAYIRIQSSLAQYGFTLADVAQERVFTVDLAAFEACLPARKRFYLGESKPASSWIQVERLPGEGKLISIEVMAVANPDEV